MFELGSKAIQFRFCFDLFCSSFGVGGWLRPGVHCHSNGVPHRPDFHEQGYLLKGRLGKDISEGQGLWWSVSSSRVLVLASKATNWITSFVATLSFEYSSPIFMNRVKEQEFAAINSRSPVHTIIGGKN